MQITPAQCRAARALRDLSQEELAQRSGVALKTVEMFERGRTQPRDATLLRIKSALNRLGVQFIDENGGGPGVRLSKRK